MELVAITTNLNDKKVRLKHNMATKRDNNEHQEEVHFSKQQM